MKFTYIARTKEGESRRGTIEASSRKAALEVLEKYELFVTSLKEEGKKGFLSKELALVRRISHKDIVIFTRQFGIMLKSVIPPVEALRVQVGQIKNPNLREKVLKMAELVETGSSLSQIFSLFPKIFNPFYVSMIKSGEATGKVADSLSFLADHMEREYNFRQKLKGAMTYPLFIVMVFIAAFFLVSFFIVPKLNELLQAFSTELPLTTRLVITLSEYFRKGGWILLIGIFAILFFLPQYLKRSFVAKKFYDRVSLRIPILGDFYKKVFLARFAENLSVLISAGLPITQALKITREMIENSVYKKIIKEAEERVARGERISSVLKEHPYQVPSFVSQMILTGEKTGRIEGVLMDIVRFYQQEVERASAQLLSILEPVLILFMGIGIAVLAVSLFIPLFQIGLGGMGT